MNNLSRDGLLTEILKVTDTYGFNTNMMPGYLYCKVLYFLDDLNPLLSEEELAIIKRHGVQRGVEQLVGRPDPRGLPDKCYALFDENVIIIQKDIDDYFDLGLELDEDDARQYVDEENRKLGVSNAQELAMIAGATSGWNLATAFVSSYLNDGSRVEYRNTMPIAPKKFDEYGNEQMVIGL